MTDISDERREEKPGWGVSVGRVSVLLIDDDETWTRVTSRLLEENEDALEVDTAHSLREGRRLFNSTDPDCVVCDYRLGDGTGMELLETVRENSPNLPFILVTGRGNESVAADAIQQGVTDYVQKNHDDSKADLLANRILKPVRKYRTERALEVERRSKNSMLDILTTTTSEKVLCQRICSQIVEHHDYTCAWIGDIEGAGYPVPLAVAGRDEYLKEFVSNSCSFEDAPSRKALEASGGGSVVVTDITPQKNRDDGWDSVADRHGFEAAVAAPLEHDGVCFGVLSVYADEDGHIDERERRAVVEYAETAGYALRMAERKRSLMSSSPVDLDIEIPGSGVPLLTLTDSIDAQVSIEVQSVVSRENGTTFYATLVKDVSREKFEKAISKLPSLLSINVEKTPSGLRCDIVASDETPEEVLASHGARIKKTVVEDGVATVSVQIPHGEVTKIDEALESKYDETDISAVWTRESKTTSVPRNESLETLTKRQRKVVQHALRVGYFERPRDTTTTELAEQFDLSRATVTQHLRAAQRKIFIRLFNES